MHAAATGRVSKGGPEGPEGPEGSLPNMLGRRPDGAALGGHGPARPAHACTCIRRLLPHRDHGDDPCEAHCPAKVTSARALAFPVPNRFQPAFSLNHPVNKYTLTMAAEQVEAVRPDGAEVEEVVADKGYHSDATLVALDEIGVRSYVSEPERGRRCWQDKKTGETPAEKRAAQKALYGNRRRIRGDRGRRLQRRRGELVERPFAHQYETGGLRRVWVRGHENVRKRVLIQAAGCNLGQLLRRLTGVGTPRSLQGRALSAICGLIGPLTALWGRLTASWDFQWTPAGLGGSIAHRQAA